MKEVLVYHDDESIYFEHKGKESGIVRFTFEMLEGLKIIEEEESANSYSSVRVCCPECWIDKLLGTLSTTLFAHREGIFRSRLGYPRRPLLSSLLLR